MPRLARAPEMRPTMTTDPHPRDIDYAFDRPVLLRYLRLRAALFWIIGLGAISLFVGVCLGGDHLQHGRGDMSQRFAKAAWYPLYGLGIGIGLAVLGYGVLSHGPSRRQAEGFTLQVEGPFLRIRQGGLLRIDHKLHFRSIIDYSLVDGPLRRRFGLKTLQLTVAGIAVPQGGGLAINGLVNVEQVRDQLAEIDAAREHSHG